MDTKTVADLLGTQARVLRRFLRSDTSTFQPVGSGSRYEFTESDMATLRTRFTAWCGSPKSTQPEVITVPVPDQRVDAMVWDEEGDVVLDDIRNPRVRARVRAIAREQENRLEMMLYAVGMHITQMGCRVKRAA